MARVLVAYATRYGSTEGIAEAIGRALRQAGVEADVRPAREVRGLNGYVGVIAGAPIYAGCWHGDIRRFVRRNRQELASVPVAYFAVGLGFRHLTDESHAAGLRAMRSAAEIVSPVDYGFFGGATRQLPAFFARSMSDGGRNDDLRDWDAIASWAARLAVGIAA